ncbi:conserved phage C-terminal domain-containing protein [Photobacterium carnosum]|uniref:conserved phage C-terminal domain-containing protein n=1 Tax=Photobacterium carnosum TaxID=2023717 RepID=UPI001E4D8514|nr:conserved phage C-terminal domain-containing protein [Photobacterium carnosum]
MLSYILSKPDNWSVSPAQLITVTKNTAKKTARDGVYAILKELKDIGFVGIEKLSTGDTNYIVYDTPIAKKSNPYNTDMVDPNTVKPDPYKPDPYKPTLIKTDLKQELKSNNKDLLSSKHDDTNPPDNISDSAKQVIQHLNAVTGSKFQCCKSNIKHINGRLRDGYTVEDLCLVITQKQIEWGSDGKWAQYIRPGTLFSPSKFSGYLQAAKIIELNPGSRPVTAADFDDISWAQDLGL